MSQSFLSLTSLDNLSKPEVDDLLKSFQSLQINEDQSVDIDQLVQLCKKHQQSSYDDIMAIVRKVSNNSGTCTFDQFVTIMTHLKTKEKRRTSKLTTLGGATDSTQHSVDEEEKAQFTFHINKSLANDEFMKKRLPIDINSDQLFEECKDGILLSKLINDSVPDTIDERVLNLGNKLNLFHMTENNNVVINSAKAVGCSVVNIGSQDLIEKRQHLVLGLIWQIIKMGLLSKISLQCHPELFRLLEEDEKLEDFLKLPADMILLRWFNFHLKAAKWHREVKNFSSDVKDSENYIVLLNQLQKQTCTRDALQIADLTERATKMLESADKIGCNIYLTPKSVVQGNPKLNLAFVANLFNLYPGLKPLTADEKASLDDKLFNTAGDRESRAFVLWMNSLGCDPFVNNLSDDLADGLVLIQVIDKVKPGLVDWNKVNKKKPLSRFKQLENTNYVVELGQKLKFSLVGLQGSDITDGVVNLTLGLVWQLMREHIIQTLKKLSKGGQDIKDSDIIEWANNHAGKFDTRISSFKDSSLKTGVFFLNLLTSLKKSVIDASLVTAGETDEDAKLNAKYAISVARKLGATIFLLPEDILEVKPKMIMTFVGSLMVIENDIQ